MSNRITIYEHNSATYMLLLYDKQPNGTTIPYNLENATEIEFYAKERLLDADEDAIIKYSLGTDEIDIIDDGSETGAEYSKLGIKFDADDIPTPRTLYYHIDVSTAIDRETIASGYLDIQDT